VFLESYFCPLITEKTPQVEWYSFDELMFDIVLVVRDIVYPSLP